MTIELLHTDCMAYMATLEDNAFELAVIDPPYRDDNQPTKDMRNNGSMDSIVGRPSAEYWRELLRVSREQVIWGANNFELPQWKGFIVWKKKTISENFTMSMCEIASLSEGLGTTSKFIEIAPQDKFRFHPNQKPLLLYEFILKHYAKPGDRILDTHLGSGSSAIAAHYAGFDFVGCELDEDYYKAACKRFDAETRQQALPL